MPYHLAIPRYIHFRPFIQPFLSIRSTGQRTAGGAVTPRFDGARSELPSNTARYPRFFPSWRGDSTVLLLCAPMKHDPTETSCQDPRGGAAGQDRTGDLRLTKSPLYHLSYGSMLPGFPGRQ